MMKKLTVALLLAVFPGLVLSVSLAGCSRDEGPAAGPGGTAPPSRFTMPEPGIPWVTDIASLPVLRYGGIAGQVSSRDKTGGNDDGFSGNTQLYIDDRGEYVVFDDFGPGCIYRIWFTAVMAWAGNLKIYVDDMVVPVVDAPFVGFFLSTVEPFLYPLTNAFHESSGGYVTYLPICYEERAKITLSVPSEFYNITYHRYDPDHPVSSFTGDEDYTLLFDQWSNPGTDPKPDLDVRTQSGTLDIPAGGSAVLVSEQGKGAVWNLFLEVDPFTDRSVSSLWLLAAWDNQPDPHVEVPLSEFFGSYYPNRSPQALLLGAEGRRLYCHLPMPYWENARVVMENRGEQDVRIDYAVDILEEAYPADAGYFSTRYHREKPTTQGRDYLFAEMEGAGHYIGVTYTMTGDIAGTYMEGDERFSVEGSRSPAIYGTGTEDYFNGGWYYMIGGPFCNPLHGAPFRLRRVGNQSRTGSYRMHLGDLVPFFREAHLGIEHDANNGDTGDDHSSVAYFYCRPENLLTLSDELDLGEPASRTAHGYQAVGAEETGELASYFEGDDDDQLVSDQGYRVETRSEFFLDIHLANAGVLLRRQYDQFQGRQNAEVFVDSVPAGIWYDVFENPVLRWAESDIPLPASLTRGKNRIHVRIVNRGGVPWTEFGYKAFSYLLP